MTYEELLDCPNMTPVTLADGLFGFLIRWAKDEAGVQAYKYGFVAEDNIRWIPLARLRQNELGTLEEIPQETDQA